MLVELFKYLVKFQSGFHAFTYLSSRAICAMLTAIGFSMLAYPPVIMWLRSMKAGQPIRELGLDQQMEKKGTPTMGGLVILCATLLSALLWMDLSSRHLVTLFLVSISFGTIGFFDDYLKITKKNTAGVSSRQKMFWLLLSASSVIAWHLWSHQNVIHTGAHRDPASFLFFPFVKNYVLDLGFFYFPFALIVLVGSSNAVNLTDGLDGLAIGPVITCSAALLVLSYVTGNAVFAKYLNYYTVHGSGEVAVFLSALIGGSIGFLWFNTWPAQVFMGDSGSLALGGILGTAAMITGHELLLILMGGVFVVEALSVIIQVASYKTRQKRVFKMAPIHHHFQKSGWPEQKITVRAWIISFMLALLSILTLKFR